MNPCRAGRFAVDITACSRGDPANNQGKHMARKTDFQAQREAVGAHLKLGARLAEAEREISLLKARLRKVESAKLPKPEPVREFRVRVLKALAGGS